MLTRGDKVISTARARSLPRLAELEEKGAATIELDVTAPLSELHAVAAKAVAIYGHIDVVVNNAGYLISGALEENTYDFNETHFCFAYLPTLFFPAQIKHTSSSTPTFLGA